MKSGFSPNDIANILESVNSLFVGLEKATNDAERADLVAQWVLIASAIEQLLLGFVHQKAGTDTQLALKELAVLIEHLRTLDDIEKADMSKFSFLAPGATKFEA